MSWAHVDRHFAENVAFEAFREGLFRLSIVGKTYRDAGRLAALLMDDYKKLRGAVETFEDPTLLPAKERMELALHVSEGLYFEYHRLRDDVNELLDAWRPYVRGER